MTWAETYAQGPGQVENYLAWIGADESGIRGDISSSQFAPSEIVLEGSEQVMANLATILRVAKDAAVARLGVNCEYILSASKKEVPWDNTHLLQTGTVEPKPEINGFGIGYNTPYAARQHEDMTLHHPKPGRKAKYLEDPARRIAPTIVPDIADYLAEVLE